MATAPPRARRPDGRRRGLAGGPSVVPSGNLGPPGTNPWGFPGHWRAADARPLLWEDADSAPPLREADAVAPPSDDAEAVAALWGMTTAPAPSGCGGTAGGLASDRVRGGVGAAPFGPASRCRARGAQSPPAAAPSCVLPCGCSAGVIFRLAKWPPCPGPTHSPTRPPFRSLNSSTTRLGSLPPLTYTLTFGFSTTIRTWNQASPSGAGTIGFSYRPGLSLRSTSQPYFGWETYWTARAFRSASSARKLNGRK